MKKKIILVMFLILMMSVVSVSAAKEGINIVVPSTTTVFVNLGMVDVGKTINVHLVIPDGFISNVHIYIGEQHQNSIYDNNEFVGSNYISVNVSVQAVYVLTIYNTNVNSVMNVNGWFSVDDDSITTDINGTDTTITDNGFIPDGIIDFSFVFCVILGIIGIVVVIFALYRKFIWQKDYSYLLVGDE